MPAALRHKGFLRPTYSDADLERFSIENSGSLGLIRTDGTTMGIPYSNDLRSRVLAAVDGGVPVRQVAALLRVSVSYIYKASLPCGRPPRKLAGHEQALLMRLGAEPDATLAELRDWLAAERG